MAPYNTAPYGIKKKKNQRKKKKSALSGLNDFVNQYKWLMAILVSFVTSSLFTMHNNYENNKYDYINKLIESVRVLSLYDEEIYVICKSYDLRSLDEKLKYILSNNENRNQAFINLINQALTANYKNLLTKQEFNLLKKFAKYNNVLFISGTSICQSHLLKPNDVYSLRKKVTSSLYAKI